MVGMRPADGAALGALATGVHNKRREWRPGRGGGGLGERGGTRGGGCGKVRLLPPLAFLRLQPTKGLGAVSRKPMAQVLITLQGKLNFLSFFNSSKFL